MGCVNKDIHPLINTMNSPPTVCNDPSMEEKQRRKRKARRVSFRDNAQVVATIEPSSTMSQEEHNDIWYSTEQLIEFKQDAKNLCQRLLADPEAASRLYCCSKFLNSNCNHNDCIRGMERYICADRQMQKCLINRVILKAHARCGDNPDRLALIAQKCTFRAQQTAHLTGIRDSALAKSLCNDIVTPFDKSTTTTTKRKVSIDDESRNACGRNVKRRLSPPSVDEKQLVTTL